MTLFKCYFLKIFLKYLLQTNKIERKKPHLICITRAFKLQMQTLSTKLVICKEGGGELLI